MTTPASSGKGMVGWLDAHAQKLVAPGATRAEWTLSLGAAALGAALATAHAARSGLGSWRLVLVALVAFDMFGGVVGNSTDSGKRFWHGRGRSRRAAFAFVAVHVAHLAVVAAAFRGLDVVYLVATAALLLLGAAVVLAAPRTLGRAVAAAAFAAAVLLDVGLGRTPGLEWFLPVFFSKLLVAHLVPEHVAGGALAGADQGASRPAA